jgi:phospholipase C
MKGHVLRAALVALVIAIGLRGPARAQADSGPCGTISPSAANYAHVIWIWMENQGYGDIIGSSQTPYINSLANECGLATNYHNITHPSLPNYVGATSGLTLLNLTPFSSDCSPMKTCSTSAPSIFSQTASWRAYEESMPSNCDGTNSGEYAVRHNPPPYFTTLSNCANNDVPYSQLASDTKSGNLPAFSFVTPNLIDDMHNGTVAQGDSWLLANVPTILNSSEYQAGTVAVFITWDEGKSTIPNDCATNTTDVNCHVPTLVISPSTTPGTQSAMLFNHYSLLRTTEQLLGLPLLGQASGAGSMVSAFGL